VRCALSGLRAAALPSAVGSAQGFGSLVKVAAACAWLRLGLSLALPVAAPVRRVGSGAGFARAAAVGSVSLRAAVPRVARAFAVKVSSAAIRLAVDSTSKCNVD
jgi:hypothetical protein